MNWQLLQVVPGLVMLIVGAEVLVRGAVRLDWPVMAAVAFICLPLAFTGMRIDRLEGTLLLAYALMYSVYLYLGESYSAVGFLMYRSILVFGLIPATVLIITISVIRSRQAGKPHD